MKNLTFNHEKHEYKVNGVLYPSVTQIIRNSGLIHNYLYNNAEWYLDRGKMIHLATELYDKGELDESSIDPLINGYLESWKKLGKKYTQNQIEIPLYDDILKYAGTLDRIDGDIKSGNPAEWHKIQVAAYWNLKRPFYGNEPMSVWYLKIDGSMPMTKKYSIRDMIEGFKIFKQLIMEKANEQ